MVRMDDRGLAHLTQEFAAHMAPERVLVVDMQDPRFPVRSLVSHRVRNGEPGLFYATCNRENGTLTGPIDAFLDGLTHVYTAETGYDRRFYAWCRDAGVASICHVMPEFDRFTSGEIPDRPTAVWVPTKWREEKVFGSRLVPVPVPVAPRPRQRTEARTFVHIIGSRAKPDRNGTLTVYEAIRLTPALRWVLFAQDRRADGLLPDSLRGCANVEIRYGSVDDRWALYDEADVLVAPRRFGGLSLPVLEANACGVPVIMGEHDPMAGYGSMFVPWKPVSTFEAAGGTISLFECSAIGLADAVEQMARGVVDVGRESFLSLRTAEADGWPGAVGRYRDEIRRVHL